MLTRRQLLLSAGALGLPMAAALPLPYAKNGGTRFGVLQSRAPFIDEQDLRGSRQRAFIAYRGLVRRSLEQHGPLDWLVGGAFPLNGPGPRSATVLEQLALSGDSPEIGWLASLAQSERLTLALGVWWRQPRVGVSQRLLVFEQDGQYRSLSSRPVTALEYLHLEMPQSRGTPRFDLAALCLRKRTYGVRIESPTGPLLPPGARAVEFEGSLIIGPDGVVLASANPRIETCLVTEA